MNELEQFLQQRIAERQLTTSGELHALRQSIITQINQYFDALTCAHTPPSPLDCISAAAVTVEVIDEHSGRIFRRRLPLDFFENDNGIRLRGETLNGQETEIVFLSAKALGKMHDLTGNGADHSHCDHQNQDSRG